MRYHINITIVDLLVNLFNLIQAAQAKKNDHLKYTEYKAMIRCRPITLLLIEIIHITLFYCTFYHVSFQQLVL